MKLKILKRSLLLIILFIISFGCNEDILDKYQPKDWLKGKIYTQIQSMGDLNTFITCLKQTGYDTILNLSGSYTVFAPTDEAFNTFFQNHPEYNALSDIPPEELVSLVEFQIINDAWSKKQLQSIDIYGWIEPGSTLSKSIAYKHMTLFRKKNMFYPAKRIRNSYSIAEPNESTHSLKAYIQSNKFSPVFFNDFFSINTLTHLDYEFYFDRAFEPGNIYYAGAKLDEEVPAENGFIYKTDKVILPLPSGEEILKRGHEGITYIKFLSLINQFSEFRTNIEATNNQPGVREGFQVDTLYNILYPELVFNIHSELTGNVNNPIFTYRDHHGLMAPSDDAFDSFLEDYIKRGWGSLDAMPTEIKKIILNAYLSKNAVYSTNLTNGFLSGNQDLVMLKADDIIQKTYGSNCTFLGLDKPIIPRAFISICRPLYLTRDYSTMMYAVEQTKISSALKKSNVNYGFYLPSDMGIGYAGDSSLVRFIDPILNTYYFQEYNRSDSKFERVNVNDLRRKILNQIAVSLPVGIANKEFIKNLGENYIIVNNKEGTVSGSAPNENMYGEYIQIKPQLYGEETDNGKVYLVNTFFNYATGISYYSLLMSKYKYFIDLLIKAGLYDATFNRFPFLVDGEYYTVFVPSAKALNDYGANTMSKSELAELLKYHFVKENLIFTDGKKKSGTYHTTRLDESSTTYITRYSNLNIRPKPDIIEILDKNGNVFAEIEEQDGKTNQMIYFDTNKSSDSKWDFITTGIVHEIDRVLIKDSIHIE